MKIYVKKEDNQPLILTIIGAIIVFLMLAPISLFILISFIKNGDFSLYSFINYSFFLIIGLDFFLISLLLITSIPIYIFKKPAAYKLKLKSKTIETYKGKEITYMTFTDSKNKSHGKYKCYTIGENHFIIGKDYILKIKELNWEPKYIEELTDDFNDKKKGKLQSLVEKTPLVLLIIGVLDVFFIKIFYPIIRINILAIIKIFSGNGSLENYIQILIINTIYAFFLYQLIKKISKKKANNHL